MGHTVLTFGGKSMIAGNRGLEFIVAAVTKQLKADPEASELLNSLVEDWEHQRDGRLWEVGIFNARLERHLAGDAAKVAALRAVLCRVLDTVPDYHDPIPPDVMEEVLGRRLDESDWPLDHPRVVRPLKGWIELLESAGA